jgi:hypothetical protein
MDSTPARAGARRQLKAHRNEAHQGGAFAPAPELERGPRP